MSPRSAQATRPIFPTNRRRSGAFPARDCPAAASEPAFALEEAEDFGLGEHGARLLRFSEKAPHVAFGGFDAAGGEPGGDVRLAAEGPDVEALLTANEASRHRREHAIGEPGVSLGERLADRRRMRAGRGSDLLG